MKSAAGTTPSSRCSSGIASASRLDQLIDDVAALACLALGETRCVRHRYRDLFRTRLGLDPLRCSIDELRAAARRHIDLAFDEADRDTWLELLMSQVIEPTLGIDTLSFVVDYPPSQAALARLHLDAEGQVVASRFELYHRGVELANGYHELLDADEQRARFAADLRERAALGPAGHRHRRATPGGAEIRPARLQRRRARTRPPVHARRRQRFAAGGDRLFAP
jgi:elongation factor P--beta-lysine ligase